MPKTATAKPTTRFQNHWMYALPDGTHVYLFDKWDEGVRVGKVLAASPSDGRPGRGTLTNLLVSEELLRRSRKLPKHEWEWLPDIHQS